MTSASAQGLLVIDKPTGITSRAAVNQVQRSLPRGTRLGHAGTLDPLATGVLVLCVGQATRLTEYVQRMDKEYRTDLTLGATSTTDDADGEVTPMAGTQPPARETIEEALHRLTGIILQVPPAFSAAKVTGRRAYDLARKGETVSLEPRPVQVYSLELLHYQYPDLTLHVRCGKGTYIRSLARDLGRQLGCGAYVRTLRRTRIGPFSESTALPLEKMGSPEKLTLLPLESALASLPRVEVDSGLRKRLVQGQAVPITGSASIPGQEDSKGEVAIFSGGALVGVGAVSQDQLSLSPIKIVCLP